MSWYDSIGDTVTDWFDDDDDKKSSKKGKSSKKVTTDSDDDSSLFSWDAVGEGLVGLFNTANAKSSAPEENRVNDEDIAQQPTGAVARTSQPDNNVYLRYLLFGMMGLGLLIAFKE